MLAPPQHPPGINMPGPSTHPYTPISPFPTTRKRRAASPDLDIPTTATSNSTSTSTPTPTWSITSPSPTSPNMTEVPAKRRRPNLANGFSGLTIHPRQTLAPEPSSPLPTYEESEATKLHIDETDDDDDTLQADDYGGLFARTPVPLDEVQVEVLTDGNTVGRGGVLDSESGDEDDEGDENDYTFRRIRRGMTGRSGSGNKRTVDSGNPQEGVVVVEQPDNGGMAREGDDLGVEDVTAQYQGVKRRGIDGISGPGRKRRRNGLEGDMDIDMDGEEDIVMGGRRRRTQWHEPEKDRIVITSLGSPDSSASERSLTPDPEDTRLAQPGTQGFTLNPSFLTHLLSRPQDETLQFQPKERGLILYRPLGIQPGLKQEEVVQSWKGYPGIADDDAGRFEEIDDDEDEVGDMNGIGQGDDAMMELEETGVGMLDEDGDVQMD